ncbi:prostate stem cell antigen-like [Vanacampus margaritifer]
MSASQLILLLWCLPLATCLLCYTCLFPAISPMDCLKFRDQCTDGHRCLSSFATATKGALEVTFYEKSCALPSQCGVRGQKYYGGLHFNFTYVCCDTDLCNGASALGAAKWGGAALCLLPALGLLLA